MGRGRRPNLALEPTRALQTQRAFRQRKAEHLATLEESVKALSEENALLRQQLDLSPRAVSASPKAYAAIAPAKGVPTPEDDAAQACAGCVALQQANRQLALAAVQIEGRVAEFQQSCRSLRSVLEHHGIALPEAEASNRSKRIKLDDETSGVHMTSQYFASAAASPSDQYARSRPPPAGTWHTPSPSAILSAPTPPASFSPRHQTYSSYNSPVDEAYRRPPAPPTAARSASSSASSRPHLPPPSPARYWSGSASGSTSPAVRAHALPAHASPSYDGRGGRRYAEEQQPAAVAYEESPRSRMLPLQEEARYAAGRRACARDTDSAAAKTCCPPPTTTGSNECGEAKPSCRTSSAAPPSDKDPKWSAPPPLGVSFDMRTISSTTKGADLPSTAPEAMAAGAPVKLDALNQDECCFGLVKCDAEGRIVI